MTAAGPRLVAGNWKMNGLREEGLSLAHALKERVIAGDGLACELVVCPPATLLHDIWRVLRETGIALGAQDCHESASGPFTGDLSAAMLKDAGCSHVILGHSERRTGHGETDDQVARKAKVAHAAGLITIVCVGETEAERERKESLDVVARQVTGSLPAGANAADTVIAYEPVWAIGSGRTPSSGDITAVHGHIRAALAYLGPQAAGIRVLYGGSVKAANAAEILALPGVEGALVGGASLSAEEFWTIAETCP